MDLCKDFRPLHTFPLPELFPPVCAGKRPFSSLSLLLSLQWDKDTTLQVAFLSYELPGLWPAWAPLLSWRRHWPCAHRVQALLMAVSQSCSPMLTQSLGWGKLLTVCMWNGQLPKAGCLKYQKVLPYSVPCCMGSVAAAGSLVVPAAASPGEQVVKASILLQLLAVSSSPSFITLWAMLRSTSNYKVKPSQKPWTEIEWKSQQQGVWGQLS